MHAPLRDTFHPIIVRVTAIRTGPDALVDGGFLFPSLKPDSTQTHRKTLPMGGQRRGHARDAVRHPLVIPLGVGRRIVRGNIDHATLLKTVVEDILERCIERAIGFSRGSHPPSAGSCPKQATGHAWMHTLHSHLYRTHRRVVGSLEHGSGKDHIRVKGQIIADPGTTVSHIFPAQVFAKGRVGGDIDR